MTRSQNHSVVESSFAHPCKHLLGGFSSGFVPVQQSPSGTIFDVLVEDDKPMWFFCAQGRHCQSGMVGSVNAPTSGEHTLQAYIDLASEVTGASTIANQAPLGGILTVDGVAIDTSNDIVIIPEEPWHLHPQPNPSPSPSTTKTFITHVPTPSETTEEDHWVPEEDHWVPEEDHWTTGKNDHWTPEAAPSPTATTRPPTHSNPTPPTTGENDYIGWVPKPGEQDQYMMEQAGGAPIGNYSWPESISAEVTDILTLIKFVEDVLITALVAAHDSLTTGEWAGIYPTTIVQTIGAMKAQAWIQRSLSTDTLQHFDKEIPSPCSYKIPMSTTDEWLDSVTTLLNLHIGLTSSALAQVADTDAWLVPCLATSMGSTARMTGVVAMMRGRMASASPREVPIPPAFVYEYVMATFVDSCPGEPLPWATPLEPLHIVHESTAAEGGRLTEIQVEMTQELLEVAENDTLYFAWMGPWGELYFTPVFGTGEVEVPPNLYGYVWVAATTNTETSLFNLPHEAVAGPAQVWIG
jgi:hypothetical protein